MSSLGSPNPFFIAGKKAYEVKRSLRFNDNDTAYLSRTPSSAGDRKKWTFSAWIKRANLGGSAGEMRIFGGNANASHIYFASNDEITWDLANEGSGSSSGNLNTTQVFRDSSAWFHLVCALDTDESTANNRMRMYMNGVEITDFGSRSNPSSGYATNAMNNNTLHTLGYRTSGQGSAGMEFDGYMAEINFIDGQQYDPSYFGETNVLTGQWNPKKYVGGYGTNGFYLNFSTNTFGTDGSGNGNNFTPQNFVLGDAVKDSPTNNFAIAQMMGTPFSSGAGFAEGNLQLTSGSTSSARNLNRSAFAPMLVNSGKWYAEFMHKDSSSSGFIGIGTYQVRLSTTSNNSRYAYVRRNDGKAVYRTAGSETVATYGSAIAQYDVVGVYLDMDAGTPVVYFSKNGQWADGSGNFDESSPTSGITLGDSFFTTDTGGNDGFAAFIFSSSDGGTSVTIHANFGQDSTFAGQISAGGNVDASALGDFKYTVPTGAKALCSANLPDPTILLPNKHFDTLLWTGTAASHTLTGLNFQPDWFWAKSRSQAYHNTLMDSVRGSDKQLWSNRTATEQTNANFLTSFNSNGLTLGDNSSGTGATNTNGHTYVGWNWNAGDTDSKTYTVTVVSDSGNKYRFDGFGTSAVTLDLAEGGTYIFNYPSAHPFRFSETSDGTHGGGTEYTTGVTVLSSTSVQIVVAASAPQLYYFCNQHSGMGGAINTNSTLGSSNFDGTIQSVVKASPTAGFSILEYTGNGTDGATVGHGLGVAPDCIITKSRNLGTIGSAGAHWTVAHKGLTNGMNGGSNARKIHLSLTQAEGTNNHGCVSAVSSTTFTLKDGSSGSAPRAHINESSGNYVAYVFSEVAGYSKFGSYQGNENANGTFVFTGFRPALVIFKRSSATNSWYMMDNKRNTFNLTNTYLRPDTSAAEGNAANSTADFLSNGFKLRGTGNDVNANSTYIYLAFSESPFKNARAR
jgi:hypothetical protein